MKKTWREALANRYFILALASTCLATVILVIFMPYYFREIIAPRYGTQLNDWLLNLLRPHDWSLPIFALNYACVLLTMVTNYDDPLTISSGLATWTGVTWLRMLTLYLFALEPPPGIIVLNDPFLSAIVYPRDFTKDLFFSGHISTMMAMTLIEPSRKLRWIKIAATILAAVFILIQHVHYSIDVIFAPLFTYLIYRLVIYFKKPLIN